MLLFRKFIYFLLITFLFIIILTDSNLIHAENTYSLEVGEKLIEERIIDTACTEILTQIGNDFYLKKLEKNKDQWIVINKKIIQKNRTGLKVNEIKEQGDRELAKALEKKLKSYSLQSVSLPPVVDYSQSEYLPPVGNQFDSQSCVGWAAGYYLRTYQEAKDIGWNVKALGTGITSHIFSPSFIYNQTNGGEDEGSYAEDAGNLLKNMGAASIENFPFIPGDYLTQPSPVVKQSAYPHRISEWRLLYTQYDSDDYIIQETKKYLNTGDLVVAGSFIGWDFMDPYRRDQYGHLIITTEYSILGGHAYVVVGYDDTVLSSDGTGAFKIVSSWGPEWADGGFCYISYKAFTANPYKGFVYTDLVTQRSKQELNVDLNDTTTFNLNFSGTGRYDLKIKDEQDQLVFEENNLQGEPGLNSYTWNGNNMAGNKAADGHYKLNIIPYKGDIPKPAFSKEFIKSGKVADASASAYYFEDVIDYIEIPITFKSEGMMNIKVAYNDTVYDLVTEEAVNAGESKAYKILKEDFDFNTMDLNQVRIIIDIM